MQQILVLAVVFQGVAREQRRHAFAHVAVARSTNQAPLRVGFGTFHCEFVGLAALRASVVLANEKQQRRAVEPGLLLGRRSDPLCGFVHFW